MVNYTRKKKGGKYVGEGTYGCVFTEEPLKCKSQNSRDKRKVISKLLNRGSADEEYIESQIWADIDPKQEFSLWADKYCKLDTDNIKSSDEMDKCHVNYKNDIKSRRLIFYQYGGKDLYKLEPEPKNYINLFKGFANLLHGISIAHKNNIAHMDIKEPNIVVEVKNDSIILRFIDFGLQLVTDEININNYNLTTYKTVYSYWPYELAFYDGKTSIRDVNDHYDRFYDNIRSNVYNYTQRNYFDKNWVLKPVGEFINSARQVNLDTLFKSVDVFALGVVLIRIVERYFCHVLGLNSNNDDEIKINLNNKRRFISELTKENFETEEVYNIHVDLANHITKPLLLLGQKMTSLEPNKRPTAEKALEEYKSYFNAFERYLQAKKIHTALKNMNVFNSSVVDDIPMTLTPSVKSASRKSASRKSVNKKSASKKPLAVNPDAVDSVNKKSVNKKSASKKPSIKKPSIKKPSIKIPDIIPKTADELKLIYKNSTRVPLALNKIVLVAKLLGSKLTVGLARKEQYFNDIIALAKEKYNLDYNLEPI